MTNAPTYFQAVRDIELARALAYYKLAKERDPSTAASIVVLGKVAEQLAREAWPLTSRQDLRLSRAKWDAEANTPEGREKAQAIREKLGVS